MSAGQQRKVRTDTTAIAGASEGEGSAQNTQKPEISQLFAESWSSLVDDPAQLLRVPCFKRSLLWGTACGSLIAAHRVHASRQVGKAIEHGILGFLAGSGLSWTTCKYERNSRQEKLDKALKDLNKLNQARRNQQQNNSNPSA